jgi:cobalamin synthase
MKTQGGGQHAEPMDKRQKTILVLWALIWALALIGSAFVFKGNPIKDWIQLVLLVVGVTVWLWQSRRQARLRG